MNLEELKAKIIDNRVPESWYSIDDGLKPDACILYKNHSIWEYFYMDEKGDRHDFSFFYKEEEAFDHLWEKLESQLPFLKR